MEKLFINSNFSYVTLIPISNGSGWSVDALSKQIASKYYVKNMNADHIVVWVDKEKQSCTADEFALSIRNALIERGAPADRIHLLLPDRMTENIILADESLIHEVFGATDYVYIYEGQNGKRRICEFFDNSGVNYKETFHGVGLLKRTRLKRSASVSPSVARFLDGLELDCWWFG